MLFRSSGDLYLFAAETLTDSYCTAYFGSQLKPFYQLIKIVLGGKGGLKLTTYFSLKPLLA